jgi:hypothetical protein
MLGSAAGLQIMPNWISGFWASNEARKLGVMQIQRKKVWIVVNCNDAPDILLQK